MEARQVDDEKIREENKKLKAKLRGVKALGTLLQDSRQEAATLRQKVSQLEDAIRPQDETGPEEKEYGNQKMLDENNTEDKKKEGDSFHNEAAAAATGGSGLSSSVEFLPESFPSREESSSAAYPVAYPVAVPGPRLSMELIHLSKQENYNTTIANNVAMIATEVSKLEKDLETKKVWCEELEKENLALKKESEKSNHIKDVVISDLRQSVKQSQQEVAFLKEQLEVKEKRELASYEYVTKREIKEIPLGKEGGGAATGRSIDSDVKEGLEAYVGQLEARVRSLEGDKKELTKVNHQWDSYYRSTKEKMDAKVQSLENELADKVRHLRMDEDSQFQNRKDTDIALLAAKERIDAEKAGKEQALQEAKAERQRALTLQHTYDLLLAERKEMDREITRLREITKSQGNGQAQKQRDEGRALYELRMEAEALKHQVEVYKTDFESERRDRERTMGELDRVKTQLKKLKEPAATTIHQQSKVRLAGQGRLPQPPAPNYYRVTLQQQDPLLYQPMPPSPPPGGAYHQTASPIDLQQQAYQQQQQQRYRRHLIPRDSGEDAVDTYISYPPPDNTNYIQP